MTGKVGIFACRLTSPLTSEAPRRARRPCADNTDLPSAVCEPCRRIAAEMPATLAPQPAAVGDDMYWQEQRLLTDYLLGEQSLKEELLRRLEQLETENSALWDENCELESDKRALCEELSRLEAANASLEAALRETPHSAASPACAPYSTAV